MTKKGKRIMWILIGVAIFLLLQWLFIGYRFSFGPFKGLGDIRMAKLPGNAESYGMDALEELENRLEGYESTLPEGSLEQFRHGKRCGEH